MEISRQSLFGRLGPLLFKALESATAFCRIRGNPYVELAHWIHQLLQLPESDLSHILAKSGIDVGIVQSDVSRSLSVLPAGATSVSDFSIHLETAIERAWLHTSLIFGASRIRGAHLVGAMLSARELRRHLLSISPQFDRISLADLSPAKMASLLDGSAEDKDALPSADASPFDREAPHESDSRSALAKYCRDLTADAHAGKLDRVIGREQEIRSMTDILLRRRQNNPLLTGDAGVGKTAVVEGFAQAIAAGDVPPALLPVRLLSLDVGSLLAGAGVKGEFESRLKALLEEVTCAAAPVILFVDEIHCLMGAGGSTGTGDAANLLKPALARGTLRTIGATTWSEYKRHIEKDPALTRRFQVMQIMEPAEAVAVAMVRGLVPAFETHHGVLVRDEAVSAAVKLSHRYIPSRHLPDKAISLLDTACARVAMSQHTQPPKVALLRQQESALQMEFDMLTKESALNSNINERRAGVAAALADLQASRTEAEVVWHQEKGLVSRILALRQQLLATHDDAIRLEAVHAMADAESALTDLRGDRPMVLTEVDASAVSEIVSDWTGIPVGRMVTDEIDAVVNLVDTLGQRVMGQHHGLTTIAQRIQTSRAGLSDPGKPVGVFLLAGPSGVGKTETALALAETLYGGEQNLITINLSEFQEAHTVSTLKGAPPGYVGYGEGGVLTEAVRRRPYSVVLLDEVEKAHTDVHEIFYQVFDKGYMEDGEGRHIDFKNTVLILTSNIGSDLLSALCADPELQPTAEALREALIPELSRVFPAAFIGRLTVVPYLSLPSEALERITRLHLGRIVTRMHEQHGIKLGYDDAIVDHIMGTSASPQMGARPLIHLIEQNVQPAIARLWLSALAEKRAIEAIHMGHQAASDEPIKFHATYRRAPLGATDDEAAA
ncbi:MAG: type VI secretion system ATPase TssH [Rhodocyclaceae bacterium]